MAKGIKQLVREGKLAAAEALHQLETKVAAQGPEYLQVLRAKSTYRWLRKRLPEGNNDANKRD